MIARVPHVLPYQGSKRRLAPRIGSLIPAKTETLYEPFGGSIAITLYAAHNNLAERFVVGDLCVPIIDMWDLVINDPEQAADRYYHIWCGQNEGNEHTYYNEVRSAFNIDRDPIKFLYLAARCVKNAVRFSQSGNFSQSMDKRRLGAKPEFVRNNIHAASQLLKGRTRLVRGGYALTIDEASAQDMVYLDPPYEGTSNGGDPRYFKGISRDLIEGLVLVLSDRNVPFILSYDGACGTKTYGPELPLATLQLDRTLLNAGRSAQQSLNGTAAVTLESVYTPIWSRNPQSGIEAVSALAAA